MFGQDRYTFRVVSIAGIEIRLHISVTIIFALIVIGLGNGILAEWHPDWTGFVRWTTAGTTGVLFLLSLLAHEMSHALVANANQLPVPRITLFLFGGVAEMEREAPTPKIEFLVAAAGPLMSFLLAFGFFFLFMQLAPAEFLDTAGTGETIEMGILSAPATAAFWLASVNMILAVFNLAPGFPLDGGRLFRAFLWWRSGDQLQATRRAADSGRIFGWALMGLGVYNLLRGDAVGGAWLILIGWFLSRLARASVSQLLIDRALKSLSVRDLMRTRFETVDSELPVDRFINDYLLRSTQLVWPVRSRNTDVGVLTINDVRSLPESSQSSIRVADVMQPISEAAHLTPELPGQEALRQLSAFTEAPLPVIDNGRILGLVHQADILRWLSLHDALG